MTDIRFFSTDNLKRKILPLLFTAVITSAIVNVFLRNGYDVFSLICTVLAAAFFAVYDFIAAHKKLGPLIYIAVGMLVMILIGGVMSTVPRGFWFMEWFLTGGETVDTLPQYIFTVVTGFTFFISSVVYYFTHIVYRVSILTLVSLIPCAIYVKAAQTAPTAYIVLLAALNIFVYVQQNRDIFASKHYIAGKKAEITAYIDFAAAAVLLALILPKPTETPFFEKFEEFTNRFNFGGHAAGVTGEYTAHSGNADNYNEMESKLLYYVYTNKPQYTKIQTFDIYEPENRWWVYSKGSTTGKKNWEASRDKMNYNTLLEAYIYTESDILDGIAEDALSVLTSRKDVIYSERIQAVDYPAAFAVSPSRITGISFLENPRLVSFMAPGGELWPENHSLSENASYNITYYDNNFVRESGWINSGLCDITYEDYGHILAIVYWASDDDSLAEAADSFFSDYSSAEKYAPENYAPVSEELRRISEEITAGLTYDYEKAEAIELFFRNGGFVYDLGYKAPEETDTPEFFISESRRGSCSDFATAYCLLARAAGLRVRFTEGFNEGTVSEGSGTVYQLYTENAHAYPEVYIPGASWVIYEPTPSGNVTGGGADAGEEGGQTDYLTFTVTVITVFILISVFTVLILMRNTLAEKLFGLRVKSVSAEKGIILIYGRFSMQCGRIFGIPSASMTAEQLSEFTKEKTGIVPQEITSVFEKVCYGLMPSDKAEASAAYKCYKACVKLMKKVKRGKLKK